MHLNMDVILNSGWCCFLLDPVMRNAAGFASFYAFGASRIGERFPALPGTTAQ
jgi:hypothetical protein